MCSIFQIKTNSISLEKIIGRPIQPSFEINSEIYPGYKSFILINGDLGTEAQESVYSLLGRNHI